MSKINDRHIQVIQIRGYNVGLACTSGCVLVALEQVCVVLAAQLMVS